MAKLSAKYEVLYIIAPAQGEEGIAALVEKFKGIVEAHGTLTSVDEWASAVLRTRSTTWLRATTST